MPAKLTVAKIVSTATPTAWSQAYHAGGFTAVLSIAQKEDEGTVSESDLQKIGKQLLDALIAEYFTLVTKDLNTVRTAVEASVEKLPQDISLSMVVGASVKNVLYIVIVNHGKALLKRGDKAGALLELENETSVKQIESVSGYLEQGDVIVLETKQFEEVLPQHELIQTIDHQEPVDLAEILSPKIHEAQNGGASAIIFSYHDEEPSLLQTYTPPAPVVKEEEKETPAFVIKGQGVEEQVSTEESKQPEEVVAPTSTVEDDQQEEHVAPPTQNIVEPSAQEDTDSLFSQPMRSRVSQVPTSAKKGISHSQKIFLTIAVIIALVLGSSIFFFLSKQDEAKRQQTFTEIYQPAKNKYEEGVGLVALNKPLALSDMQQAKDMVTAGQGKLPSDSSQYKQLQTLLSQINASIQDASKVPVITTPKAPDGASPLLSFSTKHADILFVTQDDTNFYTGDNDGVMQYNKSTGKSKLLIQNTSTWKDIGGLGVYFGNIYVLDRKDGILKYVNGTSKSAYFASGVSADLSKAASLAIDSSIYVLTTDGNILKFTRGKPDTFTVSGLDKALSTPSAIVTSASDSNVYVLDKGNSRLVVLKKTGEFVNQYKADIIKNADGLDVDEKGKKAYVLSAGTIYQIDMK